MTPFYLLTLRHGLLPWANRLQGEGHEVKVTSGRAGHSGDRYAAAWGGRFEMVPEKAVEATIRRTLDDGGAVLSDRWGDMKSIPLMERVFATPRPAQEIGVPWRIGAWWDGESFIHPHLLLYDLGAWPGGLGPRVPGGLTLDAQPPPTLVDLLGHIADPVKSSGHRGLVQAGFAVAEGEPQVTGWTGGWGDFHAHAFMAELDGMGEWTGAPSLSPFTKRFTVVAPLTVPPWPGRPQSSPSAVPVKGLTPEVMGEVYWHDIRVEEGQLLAAGLDGLVGVVRASADSLTLARGKVAVILKAVRVPEKQCRYDIGGQVDAWLAAMEAGGLS